MNQKRTIIFVGNSGCGKGTQAGILEDRIKKTKEKVLHIELGNQFRDFLSMTTDTSKKALEIAQTGQLQPEFLAIHLWSKILNLYYSKDKFLILDGTPRTLREAYILDGALKFYGVENPIVIYIETSRETAKARMLSRKRKDDTEEKIENRLNWFQRDTEKAIDFFTNESFYDFYKISGENSIEEIAKEIEEKIKF